MGPYKQKFKDKDGNVQESPYWSISYYVGKKQERETTKETSGRMRRESSKRGLRSTES
jgi:hypothetical protein